MTAHTCVLPLYLHFCLALLATIKIKMAPIAFQQCDGLRILLFTHTTLSTESFLQIFVVLFHLQAIFPTHGWGKVLHTKFSPIKTEWCSGSSLMTIDLLLNRVTIILFNKTSLPRIAPSNNSGSTKWRLLLSFQASPAIRFSLVAPSSKMFCVYSIKHRTQPCSIPCKYIFWAFAWLPFLRNDSPFTKNVDSGNSPRLVCVNVTVLLSYTDWDGERSFIIILGRSNETPNHLNWIEPKHNKNGNYL